MPILVIIIFMQWWAHPIAIGPDGAFRNPGRETVKSETEGGLQIYAAVRRAAGKGSPCSALEVLKNGGRIIPLGCQIYVVEALRTETPRVRL